MLLVEDNSKLVAANQAAAGLFKMEPSELEGRFWAGLDGQLTQIAWKQHLQQLAQEGCFSYTTDLITKDDLLRPISVEMVRAGEGQVLLCLQNLLAQEIDKSGLDVLSKDGALGFWAYNQVDDVLYLSTYLRRLLGVPASASAPEVLDLLQQKIPSADWDRIRPRMEELRSGAGAFNQQVLLTTNEGPTSLRFFARSTGNALHVTKLFGMVRKEANSLHSPTPQIPDGLEEESVVLREDVGLDYNVNNIITVSPKYQKVLQQIGQVADVDTTVLITGETGTGKELLARAVHELGERSDQPLIKVNCAALPQNLIESELFGHEKGAFTGAVRRKQGRFEMANGGTLFLDEIGELPLDLQSKLLRVLQEGEFERLGGTETIKVDVRLVAATNRNLKEMMRKGSFRTDLYYRLNVFPIENLALRYRPEDIPVLVEYFARKFAKRQNKTITKIKSADLAKLKRYAFPGNIRELENLVERAVVLCRSEVLSIPLNIENEQQVNKGEHLLPFEEMQRRHIIKALIMTEGRVTGPNGAGVLLELNDRTLVSKMRKLNIRKADYLEAFR